MQHQNKCNYSIYMSLQHLVKTERFSIEQSKLIGFASYRLHDWCKKLCQIHVITLSFDWFNGFSVSFVIG